MGLTLTPRNQMVATPLPALDTLMVTVNVSVPDKTGSAATVPSSVPSSSVRLVLADPAFDTTAVVVPEGEQNSKPAGDFR